MQLPYFYVKGENAISNLEKSIHNSAEGSCNMAENETNNENQSRVASVSTKRSILNIMKEIDEKKKELQMTGQECEDKKNEAKDLQLPLARPTYDLSRQPDETEKDIEKLGEEAVVPRVTLLDLSDKV